MLRVWAYPPSCPGGIQANPNPRALFARCVEVSAHPSHPHLKNDQDNGQRDDDITHDLARLGHPPALFERGILCNLSQCQVTANDGSQR